LSQANTISSMCQAHAWHLPWPSLLLPRYSTQPLSVNHLLSMTIVPTQEDLCGTDCCRPSTSPGAAILVVCEYCTDRLYSLRASVSTRGLPPLPGRLLTLDRLQLLPQDTPDTSSHIATSPPAAILSTMPTEVIDNDMRVQAMLNHTEPVTLPLDISTIYTVLTPETARRAGRQPTRHRPMGLLKVVGGQ
jgi:hypothetical protein